jgi:membrane protease YdiL (CAAX protease family)
MPRELFAVLPQGTPAAPAGSSPDVGAPEAQAIVDVRELPIAEDTLVSTSLLGRRVRLGDAIDHHGPTRDALLALSPDPRLDRWRKLRAIGIAGPFAFALAAIVQWVELNEGLAELAKIKADPHVSQAVLQKVTSLEKAVAFRPAYLSGELLFAVAATLALGVGLRRWRGMSVIAGVAGAVWWLQRAGRPEHCFGVKGKAAAELVVAGLGLLGALVAWLAAPSESSIAARLRERLGLPPSPSVGALSRDTFSRRRLDVAATFGAAALGFALPLTDDLLSKLHTPFLWRFAVFVGICGASFVGFLAFRRERARVPLEPLALLGAALAGFGLAVAADLAAQSAMHLMVDVTTCFAPQKAAAVQAIRVASERETTAARQDAASSVMALLVTVVAVPLSEELLYRGTLQRIARRAFGAPAALAITGVIFGVAHMSVYQHGFYQTIALGLAFAAAYEIAGGTAVAVIATAITHALWNGYLTLGVAK